MAAEASAEKCPGFGRAWDGDDVDCRGCKEDFPEDYDACQKQTRGVLRREGLEHQTELERRSREDDGGEDVDIEVEEAVAEAELEDEDESGFGEDLDVGDEDADEPMVEAPEPEYEGEETELDVEPEPEPKPKRGPGWRRLRRDQVFVEIMKEGSAHTLVSVCKLIHERLPKLLPDGSTKKVAEWLDILVGIGVVQKIDDSYQLDAAYLSEEE